jgi:hypothetical protein
MWSYVIMKANDAAGKAREEARSAGQSRAEQEQAGERAFRDDLADTAMRDLNITLKLAKILSGLDGN